MLNVITRALQADVDSQSRLVDLHNVRAKLEEQLEQVGQGTAAWGA